MNSLYPTVFSVCLVELHLNRPFAALGQKKKRKIASFKMVIYLLFLQVLLLLSSLKKHGGFATSSRVLSRQGREMGIFFPF